MIAGQDWTGLMGGKQLGFSDYEQSSAKKQTKRERFLSEMEKVLPWKALFNLIELHYPKTSSKGGRPPYPLQTMLPIYRSTTPIPAGMQLLVPGFSPQPRSRRGSGFTCRRGARVPNWMCSWM